MKAPGAKSETLRRTAIGALMGLVLFGWLVGFEVVRPSHVAWLLDSPDPMTHYLGWAFFRADRWRWPLGLNPSYGIATGSSIVYSDSIPLLALLLKPLSRWLGEPFQYTGLWLLLCFLLQGIFAMLLVGRFIYRVLPQTIAAALLMLPFVFLKRLDGHYALAGQWTILWALYLYFTPFPSCPSALRAKTAAGAAAETAAPRSVWVILATMACLIHLYLAVLVLAIWSADLVRRYLARPRLRPLAMETAVLLPVLLLTMWLAGYFCLGFSDTRTPNSAGAYSMNLLSPIDSRGASLLLPALPLERQGQVEGAAYLGVGIFALLLIALVAAVIRHPVAVRADDECSKHQGYDSPWPYLLIACTLLLLFAISPIITFGSTRLLALPNYWGPVSEVLRATGRMSWPAAYVLPLFLLATLASRLSTRALTTLLAAVLLLQLLDLSPMLHATRRHFRASVHPIPTLTDPFWTTAPERYRRIVLVPSDDPETDWRPLAFFAAEHGMAINHGYFARMDWNRKEAANQQAFDDLRSGRTDPGTLYILTNSAARALVPPRSIRQIGGYSVLVGP